MSPTLARRTAHMIGNARIDPVWPALELLGFARVAVPARGSVRVTFSVPAGALAHAGHTERIVDPGRHTAWVGASSADLRLRTELDVVGSVRPLPLPRLEWVTASAVALPAPDPTPPAAVALVGTP